MYHYFGKGIINPKREKQVGGDGAMKREMERVSEEPNEEGEAIHK